MYDTGVGVASEDFLCVMHVLLDLVCKDITEVLIVWVTFSFHKRLAEMSAKKVMVGTMSAVDVSYANIMQSRVPRPTSMFEELEDTNPEGLVSQQTLPSMSQYMASSTRYVRPTAQYYQTQQHVQKRAAPVKREPPKKPEPSPEEKAAALAKQREAQKKLASRVG